MATYGTMKHPDKGLVPYLISGPLSKESSMIAYLDAFLHLGTWAALWVFEIITFIALSDHEEHVFKSGHHPGDTHDDHPHELTSVSLGSLVTLAIATLVIVLVLGAHWLTNGIEDGKLPPVATSLITGGLKGSLFFSILVTITALLVFLMEDATITQHTGCDNHAACAHRSAATLLAEEETFLDYIIALMLLKFYALSMVLNNLRFVVSTDDAMPHHVVSAN